MDTNTPTPASEPTTPDLPTFSDSSAGETDWASRLDSAMDTINKETGAKLHGKADEPKEAEEPKEPKISKKKPKAVEATKEAPTPVKEVEEEEKTADEGGEDKEAVEEETPKNLTEKAAVKWSELRNENRTYKKEIESLKAELDQLKSTPVVDTSEVDKLRQVNAEYEKELNASRVEGTREYKANVVEPMVNVVGFLNSLAEKYELTSRDLLDALAESDQSKQSDLLTDLATAMNERDRLRLYSAADDYNEIIRRREHYKTTSQEFLAKLEADRQSQLTQQQAESEKLTLEAKQAYEKATAKVFMDLKKAIPSLADEEVATDVQRLAKEDYTSASPELKSYLAHSGALLPYMLKSLKEARENLEKANKTIAGYRNGSPKAGSGSSDFSKAVPEDVGFLEALDHQLG
jgi:hypothetical protein